MKHIEFVEKCRSGEFKVVVDPAEAGFIYKDKSLLPREFRIEQVKLRSFALIVMLVGITSFFFIPWWAAIIFLIISFSKFSKAQNKAAEHVLAASLEDPIVYELAMSRGVFTLHPIG